MCNTSEVEVAKGNLLQVRTYDVMITYDKYYQTPRIWLLGYDEVCAFLRRPYTQHESQRRTERHAPYTLANIPRRLCRSRVQDSYD